MAHPVFKDCVVVFTGRLALMSREDAIDVVRSRGGHVHPRVTRRLTHLVLGEAGFPSHILRSNKLQQAETLAGKGHPIEILPEERFFARAGIESTESIEQRFYAFNRLQRMFPAIDKSSADYFRRRGVLKVAQETHTERYYGFGELLTFRRIQELLNRGLRRRDVAARLLHQQRTAAQLELEFDRRRRAGGGLVIREPVRKTESAAAFYADGCKQEQRADEQDRAIQSYERALECDPMHVDAMLNLARLRFKFGDSGSAKQLLDRAREIDPGNAQAHFNLGVLYEALHEYTLAREAYATARLVDPAFEAALFNQALLAETREAPSEALELWKQYLATFPDSPDASAIVQKVRVLETEQPAARPRQA